MKYDVYIHSCAKHLTLTKQFLENLIYKFLNGKMMKFCLEILDVHKIVIERSDENEEESPAED